MHGHESSRLPFKQSIKIFVFLFTCLAIAADLNRIPLDCLYYLLGLIWIYRHETRDRTLVTGFVFYGHL